MSEDDLPEDYDVIVLGTGICFIVTLYSAVIVQKKVPNYAGKAIVIPFSFNLKVFLFVLFVCFVKI